MRSSVFAALILFAWALIPAKASALQGDAELYRFQANDQYYAEIFFYILGSTVTQVEIDTGRYSSTVEVLYIIERDDATVVAGDKYNLISPASGHPVDFMDIKRVALQPGDYTLVVEFRDMADSVNALEIREDFAIPESAQQFSQSDIQLLSVCSHESEGKENFMRNGIFMQPLPYAYYHDGYDKLIFYTELYRSDLISDGEFYISYHISTYDQPSEYLLSAHKKLQPKQVNPLLIDLDISALSSGKYLLQLEVHKWNKDLVSRKEVSFSRSNPEADQVYRDNWQRDVHASFVQTLSSEQLEYSLRALQPIISSTENDILNYLLKKGEDKNRRFFLHRIWYERNSDDPFEAYSAYMNVARWVDETYGAAFGHGFETDRGHIYLKYGQPDDIVAVEDEPSAPPYEIWIYYDFPRSNQSNVKFLFYNPSLAGNDFRLLHSTAVGELSNPRWEVQLYGDAPTEIVGDNPVDATRMQENIHRNAREYFNDF